MAFRQFFNCSNNNNTNKVCHFQLDLTIRGRSTRQISLRKIVNTICSVSPPDHDLNMSYSSPSFNVIDLEKKKTDCALYKFDLNLPLGSSSPPPPPPPLADDCGAMEKSSGGEIEETVIVNITTTPELEAPPSDLYEYRIFKKGEGCLELLIEAAKFISGGFEDEVVETEEIGKRKSSTLIQNGSAVLSSKGKRSKRVKERENRTAAAELCRDLDGGEESVAAPVRRSRSGRCNVLPLKYRDSVFEPLRTLSGQRSSPITAKRK